MNIKIQRKRGNKHMILIKGRPVKVMIHLRLLQIKNKNKTRNHVQKVVFMEILEHQVIFISIILALMLMMPKSFGIVRRKKRSNIRKNKISMEHKGTRRKGNRIHNIRIRDLGLIMNIDKINLISMLRQIDTEIPKRRLNGAEHITLKKGKNRMALSLGPLKKQMEQAPKAKIGQNGAKNQLLTQTTQSTSTPNPFSTPSNSADSQKRNQRKSIKSTTPRKTPIFMNQIAASKPAPTSFNQENGPNTLILEHLIHLRLETTRNSPNLRSLNLINLSKMRRNGLMSKRMSLCIVIPSRIRILSK